MLLNCLNRLHGKKIKLRRKKNQSKVISNSTKNSAYGCTEQRRSFTFISACSVGVVWLANALEEGGTWVTKCLLCCWLPRPPTQIQSISWRVQRLPVSRFTASCKKIFLVQHCTRCNLMNRNKWTGLALTGLATLLSHKPSLHFLVPFSLERIYVGLLTTCPSRRGRFYPEKSSSQTDKFTRLLRSKICSCRFHTKTTCPSDIAFAKNIRSRLSLMRTSRKKILPSERYRQK